MNILLVYPKYPDTFWSYKHILKYVSKKAVFPPLGLLTIAPMLPKDWNKKLADLNITELKDKDIEWADMIFISAMLVQKESAQQVIKRCKGKTIVMGGPAPTSQPELFKEATHLVLNEGEATIPLFLKDLKKGKAKRVYTSKERPDITKTPVPQWSLINFKDYVNMPVQYSRGCPFNCEFCDIIIMNGRVPRTKTPEQMIKEFQSLYDAGWRKEVFIVDDNFIGNKANAKKMLIKLIQWQKQHKYPVKICTEASINLADDKELMQMMSAANFDRVFLGLETPNNESLKECGKIQNASKDIGEAVKSIHRNGMQVMGGFIVGFDNDTENIFKSQFKFIQKVGIVTAMIGILTALPQTRLWHRLKAEGRLLDDATGNVTTGRINFIPKMGKEKLVTGYKKLFAKIYSPKQYYKRIDTFISHYRHTAKSRISMADVKAFLRSVWSLGIASRYNYLYWKLLLKTGFRNRKALPAAVELAIVGLHFETISKKMLKI